MKVLVTLNYQREIPPFMLTELHYAAKEFDRVVYITRELENDNSFLIQEKNVSVQEIKKTDRLISLLKLPFLFLRKEIRHEVMQAVRHRSVPPKYVYHLGKELYCTQNLYHAAEPVVKSLIEQKEDIVVQATWFDVSAYAASRIKEKYPKVKAVSFAHSFEIDPAKSFYIGVACDDYKLQKLDRVYFIAKGMIAIYKAALPKWINYDMDKMKVRYLGSVRYHWPIAPEKDRKSFTICTCSGMTKVKRVQIVIYALALWQGEKIHWVHLGGGPLMEQLQQLAEEKLGRKQNIAYEFTGKLENVDVHKFYRDHHIDLFLNVSESEGLPVSIMEAMSYGIPAMATDVGATKEIVRKEELLLPKDLTPEELVEKIEWFHALPQSKQQEYRSECRTIWENEFNAEKNATQYYKELGQAK